MKVLWVSIHYCDIALSSHVPNRIVFILPRMVQLLAPIAVFVIKEVDGSELVERTSFNSYFIGPLSEADPSGDL